MLREAISPSTPHLGAKLMLRGGVEGLMASLSMLALAHGAGWPSTFSVPVSLVSQIKMNFSSITVAFLLSGVQLVDASGKFFILRSKMNGQCCSHAGLEKVLFKDCDLTNLDETVLWQDQVATTTATGVKGTGTLDTGLILTYDGTLYIVPKNGIQQLKKTAAAKAKKASWSYNGSQLYFANKDWTF